MNTLLKLSLLALACSMIGGTPLSPQKRFSFKSALDSFASATGKAVTRVKSWFSDTDDNKEEEAEKVRQETIAMAQEMIARGNHLLDLATNLSLRAYDEITDPQNREKVKAAVDSMTETANDVIEAGQTIMQNKDNIKAALHQSYKEVSDIAKESMVKVRESLRLTKESMIKARPLVVAAGISAKNSAIALTAALKEMVETSDLIAKANRSLEVVGENLWSFGKSIYHAGVKIGKSIRDGAKRLGKASGLWKDATPAPPKSEDEYKLVPEVAKRK